MAEPDDPDDLPNSFHIWVDTSMGEAGVHPQPLLVKRRAGDLEMVAMDLGPADAMAMVAAISRDPDTLELIYGLDRFTRPGQGTEFGDCLAGAWLAHGVWRPFVINYRPRPKLVRPFDWHNAHWSAAVRRELAQTLGPIAAAAPPPAH